MKSSTVRHERHQSGNDGHERRVPATSSPTLTDYFATFAQRTALWTGHPATFLLAVAVVIVWVISGPAFHYSDTWQLVINTGTTIITFLMVFLIQSTQNRDTMAVQLKLSELVLAMKGAQNKFAGIEDLTDEELAKLHEECRARAEMTMTHLERRHQHHAKRRPAAAHRTDIATRKSHRAAKS
jgi:low affinity Fe/Cu permease